MKKITKLLAIVGILTLSFLFTQCTGKEASKEQSGSTEKAETTENSKLDSKLKEASEAFNKFCPALVNEYTRIDKTEILPDKTFNFQISLLDDSFDKLNEEEEVDLDFAKSQALVMLNQKEWSYFKKESVNFLFSYKNKKGEEIFQLKITPEDYK